jgi:capsular polysaccharide biosynthesis protein
LQAITDSGIRQRNKPGPSHIEAGTNIRSGRLALVDEQVICRQTSSIGEFLDPRFAATRLVVAAPHLIGRHSQFPAQIGPAGGGFVPQWCLEDPTIYRGMLELYRLADAFFYPSLGILVTPGGAVMQRSFGEASFLFEDLAQLPFAENEADFSVLNLADDYETVNRVAVTMPYGGITNYGHFVIDCLSGVATIQGFADLSTYRFLFPELASWHIRHLALMNVSPAHQVSAPIVRLRDVIFTSCMDHFLHVATDVVGSVTATQRASVARSASAERTVEGCLSGRASGAMAMAAGAVRGGGQNRVYLSRRGMAKRRFSDEEALEIALRRMGFMIVAPERLSVDEQIGLFTNADVVVGFTGAGFANVIYCRPKARIIEIQTASLQGIWVRNLALIAGCAWYPFFAGDLDQTVPKRRSRTRRPLQWDTKAFCRYVARICDPASTETPSPGPARTNSIRRASIPASKAASLVEWLQARLAR